MRHEGPSLFLIMRVDRQSVCLPQLWLPGCLVSTLECDKRCNCNSGLEN